MGHLKKTQIDWIDEAWAIKVTLDNLPSGPPGLLGGLRAEPDPDSLTWLHVRHLHDSIGLHLAYRLRVVHNIRARGPDGTLGILLFTGDPHDALLQYDWLMSTTIAEKLSKHDRWAIDAQRILAHIQIDRFACPAFKASLPLLVASIGGETLSQSAAGRALGPRQRDSELRDAKRDVQSRNPHASWKDILRMLEGDELVVQWDASEIQWVSYDGTMKKTKTKTFQNWKRAH